MTCPLPGVDEYADTLAQAADPPGVTHRVCKVCVPEDECMPGTLAVCGQPVLCKPPRHIDRPCIRCVKRWQAHVMSHFGGRGR